MPEENICSTGRIHEEAQIVIVTVNAKMTELDGHER
ncbi:hypothetical protein AWB80_07756 [Caballeronia pedi]|uniref:Uncharacterized protein n=1 Tax=Caballeronia pedi TaxID=1777141 RepID=A0A158DZT7_9BURK|nr:hypothetical protein AWB80_07756 [Caballeronia pedi]